MEKTHTAFLAVLWVLYVECCSHAEAQTMDAPQALSTKQHSIIPIAAYTANGDLDKLRPALHAGLEAGLTVNEIKEILVQMYAYAGFPRSLNGITAFMAVMDERQAKGIKDEMGKEASPVPADMNKDAYGAQVRARLAGQDVIPPPSGYQLFTPVIDTFLKEHLFADIFARDNLDYQSRELATIAALASMPGTAGQLQFHLGAAMHTGLTAAQMQEFIAVLKAKVGTKEAESADAILRQVLRNRAQEGSGPQAP
jgi:4-carboxymuconolactone decarboxylase